MSYLFEQDLIPTLITIASAVLFMLISLNFIKYVFSIAKRRDGADLTRLVLFKRMLKVAVITIGVIIILLQFKPLKSFITPLLAGSGILVVALGFAGQEAFGNLISGIFISIFHPFKIGDRIKLMDNGTVGIVEDISLRHTVVRTPENARIIVPNSIINKTVLENYNYRDSTSCGFLKLTVSYSSDLRRAIKIIYEEIAKQEKSLQEPSVSVTDLGLSGVEITASVWAESAGDVYSMLCDLRLAIKERFDAEGIEFSKAGCLLKE